MSPRPRNPTLTDQAIAARTFEDYRNGRDLPEPTRAELFAATFTGTTPPDCLCGGGPAVALNSFNRPICRVCCLLPEVGCDFDDYPPSSRREAEHYRDVSVDPDTEAAW